MSKASLPVHRHDVFSIADIAAASDVPVLRVREVLDEHRIARVRGCVRARDAARIVRRLQRASGGTERAAINLLPDRRRRTGVSLFASGAVHAAFVAGLLVVASMGLLDANETEQFVRDQTPVHLVYLMTPGPGGGGGGGGLKIPVPPARAERKAPVIKKVSSPVPPVRKDPPPPKPAVVEPPKPVEPPKIDPPKVDPPKVDPPKPAQTVQAPVAPVPADPADKPGVLDARPAPTASAGPGSGGGTGTGAGSGIGQGRGGGIGPGDGGGTGGGPYQPGSGIEPPTLLREVKPGYTEEARRRSIAGDVQLEIIVKRDGTVGSLRVVRGLGAGLDEKAMEAVRQWRFGPAKRQGIPVDVVVQVSVEFSLR